MQKSFQDILSSLNPRQRQAVETIYGPVLVIAGPGSGKTQILGARIANILHETDYMPSNILCLTFTDNAARNMRDRLARMIGQDAYRVAIHTFHSFGNEILARYRYLFREFSDSGTIDTMTASRILDEILAPLAWNDPYKPGMRAGETIQDILGRISDLKKGGITPSLYRAILDSNALILETLTPLLTPYFERIDALSQKKEDKLKKIELFKEMTVMVQQLSVNEDLGGYNPLITTIRQGLEKAWDEYDGESSAKFITAWKEEWTTKNYKGDRIWKESEKLKKQYSLSNIYELYQNRLAEEGLVDFSDMILRAIELVERDPTIQANLAEQYQFILIDEFQDTNEAQMRLVNTILSVDTTKPNIFAVGDDDQSIYKFQGANTKNIRDFHGRYEDTELIILDTNYRSTGSIISSSRAVIESQSSELTHIFPGISKEFKSHREEGIGVDTIFFDTELHEISSIVQDIKNKIDSGVQAEEIAIIVKKNKSLENIAKGLIREGINVSMSKSESIWEDEIIILIRNIIKYLHSLNTRQELGEILIDIVSHPCWNIPRLTLWNISRDIYHARRDDKKSWIEQFSRHEIPEIRDLGNFLKELSNMSEYARLEDVIDAITGASSLALGDEYDEENQANPLQISLLGSEKKPFTSPIYSYFFGHLSNHNSSNMEQYQKKARSLANIKKLTDEIRNYKKQKPYLMLEDAIDLLSMIEKYDIRIETSHLIGNEKKAVNLITIHKAKGLEWDHVYVPFLTRREYKLGKVSGATLPKNLPLEADKDDDADIARLVYTGYTRARTSLTVSYSTMSMDERVNEPLSCINPENPEWQKIDDITPIVLTETLEEVKQSLWSLPYEKSEEDFLRDRIDKQFIMSATALQNFLDITSGGPTHFIANNILRFPGAKNIAGSYGSAMHAALEDFFTDYKNNNSYKKEILFTSFEKSLKDEGFEPKIETTWLEKGRENLEALYTELVGKTYGELSLEKDFRTEGGGVWLGDIQLTGKIDRIERLADDTLIVTDYKTGGGFDTFDGKGAEYTKLKQWKYRLQLAFYAILFELSPRYRMFPKRQFELFFIEKNHDEDRFHRVTEYIHEGEIERTKSLIKAATECIRSLNFPDMNKYPQTVEGIRMFEEDLLSGQI
ncbi:ATP-dependent helicase [Candidatus Gracilibacteria bacterium]|nr:ATP-dependent helicase [Candidatus Gracilibacteria bacterium]